MFKTGKWLFVALAAASLPPFATAYAKDEPIVVEVMKPAEFSLPGVHRLAVARFGGPSAEAISNAIQAKLFEGKAFDLIERARIDEIMKEQGISLGGAIDPSTASQIGKIAGVDALIIGQVDDYGVNDETSMTPLKKRRLLGRNEQGQNVWQPYDIQAPTTIRTGRVSVTFKLVKVETGEIVAIKNSSAQFQQKHIQNPNSDEFNYNILFETNPYDKCKADLPPTSTVEIALMGNVSHQLVNSISPHKEQVALIWEDDIGKKEGEPIMKMLQAGLTTEALEMMETVGPAILADPKAKSYRIVAAHYDYGLVQEINGNYEKALESYKKALVESLKGGKPPKILMDAMTRVKAAIADQGKLQNQREG
jgi:curli biogenesis system outer membrane secretion channel CsgG